MSDPIRIFVGTEPKTEVYRHVLQHSITSRTKAEVEFTPMIGRKWEYPTAGLQVGTGFSLRRWMIPAACGWRGRAIYLDADQTVFADIAGLWGFPDRPQSEKGISAWMTYQPDKFCKSPWPQSSVMVIDCAAAEHQPGWRIDWLLADLKAKPVKEHYAAVMHCAWMKPAPACIPEAWNHLNKYEPGKTRLLHFTSEPKQPLVCPEHPLSKVWEIEAVAAIKAGAVPKHLIEEGLKKFGVKEDWRSTNGIHSHWARLLTNY